MKKKLKSLNELDSVSSYLKRIGAEARSLRRAVVLEAYENYKRDVSVIEFKLDGRVSVHNDKYAPTDFEQQKIAEEFKLYEFPQLKLLPRGSSTFPSEEKNTPKEDVFEFRDKDGMLVMLQVRKVNRQGEKYYLPYTYWDDEEWRSVEPEGLLPLWGLDRIGHNTTAFIHEGAKAARAVQEMIEAQTVEAKEKLKRHPWGKELSAAVHLGWIGGALSPNRTEWAVLNKLGIKTAYIVSDNDKMGISAVSQISQSLRMPTFHVQFTNEWPAAFDLADTFPAHMFKVLDDKERYVGPDFRSCLHPATWATDVQIGHDDKATFTLREHFKDMWAYIEEADTFVCKPMPNIIRQERILNNMLSSFSHTQETSKLLFQAYTGRTTSLCYRPDRPEQIITNGVSSSINLHIPSSIKAEDGNPEPFLEFLEYLFPIKDERKGVERWVATLIGRPDVRMEFALLLISEHTGIGKTTLGSAILAPLVNPLNVGFPREADIIDNTFNDWVANKRLIICNEIYSGHSWKAYHALKSLITDKEINVNQKYQRPYVVENWAHILACSNSMRALKMEGDDRRWFYPEVTEERWPKERFSKLRDWLSSGGLGIIRSWAENYQDYVTPGERAPMTSRKKEMIEGSRSEAQAEAVVIADALKTIDKPAAVAMKDVVGFLRSSVQGKIYDSDYEIRKAMMEAGASDLGKRFKIAGRMQYIIANYKLKTLIANENDEAKHHDLVKQYMVKPNDLVETSL